MRLILFFLGIGWLSAGFAAEYSNYDISIKKGTRGKRSGDISRFYYALPDHDLLALKINLEPMSNANAQSWPSATRLEVANIWEVLAQPNDFVLEHRDGTTYRSLSDHPTDETGARQYYELVKFYLKDSGNQALLWPNWLWFDIPKAVLTEDLVLRFGDARLSLEGVKNVVRECTPRRLKGGTCDYQVPAEKPHSMVTFRPMKENELYKDHYANYSIYPTSCKTKLRNRLGYFLGQARNDQTRISRYQARIQAGDPIILSAFIVDPGFSPTNEDDRNCSFLVEMTLEPDQDYEIRSRIFNNRCSFVVYRPDAEAGSKEVEVQEIPAKFGGKPNCKKYLKSLEHN